MLPQQHRGHCQEPYRELFDYLRINWLLTTKSLHPLLELFTDQPVSHLVHVAHSSQSGSTVVAILPVFGVSERPFKSLPQKVRILSRHKGRRFTLRIAH